MNARVYYVLESKKNGKLLDVIMWGGAGDTTTIFVNGYEVKENEILYNAIIPFLPNDLDGYWEPFKQCSEK